MPPRLFTFIDLFAGVGGIRIPFDALGGKCVFSSEINAACRQVYAANFGEEPFGDITRIPPESIPDHDILLGGFPCQAFSIIGRQQGFQDTRGTLFFNIEQILKTKRPRAFLLENVKQLRTHDGGRTYRVIQEILKDLGYHVHCTVLNSLDFGVPQKRERTYIVGLLEAQEFVFPEGAGAGSLADILEDDETVHPKYFASEHIRRRRQASVPEPPPFPTIWHENKSGHVSALPYSCALRAYPSHNYLLVNGKRRLTEREMLRLQGFPDWFKVTAGYAQIRQQAGNAVTVPVIAAIAERLLEALHLSTAGACQAASFRPMIH